MRHKIVTIVLGLFSAATLFAEPDAGTIIQRSVASNEADWKAAPDYSYTEDDRSGKGSRTYEVTMIDGTPYKRLVKVDGEPLTQEANQKEQRRLESATRKRKSESPDARQQRIDAWEKGRQRDHVLMDQLSKAFNFTLTGQQTMGSHNVFVLQATPRPGYAPPNREARALLGMEGQLWIDTEAFQWVKVTAKVIHPVSIVGFLARVEPGTDFELEKEPVAPGIWLPTHFAVESNSRILEIVGHHTRDDQTYSSYHRSAPDQEK